jgi:chorismate synthase
MRLAAAGPVGRSRGRRTTRAPGHRDRCAVSYTPPPMTTTRLRLLTAGESHGPSLTGILEGMPAGLRLDEATIARDLARRQQGFGKGGRMALEQDRARITAGVMNGRTTGGPIALVIDNRDHANWADKDVPKNAMTTNVLLAAILVLFLFVGAQEAMGALKRIMG